MKVSSQARPVTRHSGTPLVVLAPSDEQWQGPIAELDQQANGWLSKLSQEGELSTRLGDVQTFYHVTGLSVSPLMIVGAGPASELDAGKLFRLAGAAAKRLAQRPRDQVAFAFGSVSGGQLAAAVAGAMNGCTGQELFRHEPKLSPFAELTWLTSDAAAVEQGETLGAGMLLSRELVNLPANYMYPEAFARRAADVAISCGLELEVWDELRLRREGCDALLAVAAGSAKPPRLLILRYSGADGGDQAPLALVGKGVTFDSGGLSLKPSEGMLNMKCDMAGAATVLGTMYSIGTLRPSVPVVGVIGLVENMINGNSYKLGDVLRSRSGKTIEIHNTDAEGRLVLADALNVALDESPAAIVDLATLTGACLVALGKDIAGLMGNDLQLQSAVEQAAEAEGELVWPLPMHASFREEIQGQVADIKNIGDGRWGGAITAAKFLEEFVEDTPWLHIDIAGPAFLDKPKSHLDAGGTGVLVRTLTRLIENYGSISN